MKKKLLRSEDAETCESAVLSSLVYKQIKGLPAAARLKACRLALEADRVVRVTWITTLRGMARHDEK